MKLIITENQLKRIVEGEEKKGKIVVYYPNIEFFIKKCPFDFKKKIKPSFTDDGYPIPTLKNKLNDIFFSNYSVELNYKEHQKEIKPSKVGDIGYLSPDGKLYGFSVEEKIFEIKQESIGKMEDFKGPKDDHDIITDLGYQRWVQKNIIDMNIIYTDLETEEVKTVKF